MKYILDSANIDLIEKWKSQIVGVTTNPFLLHKEGLNPIEFIRKTKQYNILKFIPVFNEDDFYRTEQEKDSNVVYKISMTSEFFDLIKKIKSFNLPVAATTVYDIIQLNWAIEMGCDFSMVYIAKNEDSNFLQEASSMLNRGTKLVGASFRTKNHVKDAILAGMDYSTISDEVLSKLSNSQAEKEIEEMRKLWY